MVCATFDDVVIVLMVRMTTVRECVTVMHVDVWVVVVGPVLGGRPVIRHVGCCRIVDVV